MAARVRTALLTLALWPGLALADETQRSLQADLSPLASIEIEEADALSKTGNLSLGVAGQVTTALRWGVRVGIGTRYNASFGENATGHFVAVPGIVSYPVYKFDPRRKVEAFTAIGLGAGLVTRETLSALFVLGVAGEIGASYLHPLGADIDLAASLGFRVDHLPVVGSDSLNGETLIFLQIAFVRVGLNWH